jgi:hypothetical protein
MLRDLAHGALSSRTRRFLASPILPQVQQLGYIATCGARRFLSSLGFFALVQVLRLPFIFAFVIFILDVLLQSSDYIAPVIDVRIRDFLATFPGIIRDTPASVFENFRSGAASDVAETDKVQPSSCYVKSAISRVSKTS